MSTIESVSNEIVFKESASENFAVVAIDDTHVFIVERYGSRIGTISGNAITFGDEATFTERLSLASAFKIDSTHVLIIGSDSSASDNNVAFIATIDGTAISYGDNYVWYGGNASTTSYDFSVIRLDSTHFCASFRQSSSPYQSKSVVITLNGYNISSGTDYNMLVWGNNISSCRLDDTHFCVACKEEQSTNLGRVYIGTVSNGDEISFSSPSVFSSNSVSQVNIVSLDSTHICVFWNATNGKYRIGTISGNSITWDDIESFSTYSTSENKAVLVDSSTIAIVYNEWSDGAVGTIKTGQIENYAVTWDDGITVNQDRNEYQKLSKINDSRLINIYRDGGNSDYGTLVLINFPAVGGYVRPDNITGLYNLSSQGSLRGKASEGFVRPTLRQFFAPYRMAFEEIASQVMVKSVIIDTHEAWGVQAGFRSIEFYDDDTLYSITTSDFDAYASGTPQAAGYAPEWVFDTTKSKTGAAGGNSWVTTNDNSGQERLIVVFDTPISFNKIIINAWHHNGTLVYASSKHIKIYISTSEITDTTFDASISNSTKIFDGNVPQHVENDVVDDWEPTLI